MTITKTSTKKTTTSTVTPARGGRKRASVPAPAASGSSTSVMDALDVGAAGIPSLPVTDLHPHPHNPRRELGDLTELTGSIRAHGVRQNLLVVPNPDEAQGGYRVVIGHRRLAAAVAAGLDRVPAVVDRDLDEARQLELMLLENIQRQDLSPVEEGAGYQGLLDLGLTQAQISERTGRSAATVKARLRLVALPPGAREKVHVHQATLADAELLAKTLAREDVAALPEVVERLEAAFGRQHFESTVRHEVGEVEHRAERARVRAEIEASGARFLETPSSGATPKGAAPLHDLTDSAKPAWGSPRVKQEAHTECPGRVAWFANSWTARVVEGCDYKGLHRKIPAPGAASTAEPDVDRKTLIANNKAAQAVEPVRRRWVHEFVTERIAAGTFPEDAIVFVASRMGVGSSVVSYAHSSLYQDLRYAGAKVGRDQERADLATPVGAWAHLVALAAASVEEYMLKDFWRSPRPEHTAYLTQLAAWGYELSDVERLVTTPAKKARAS